MMLVKRRLVSICSLENGVLPSELRGVHVLLWFISGEELMVSECMCMYSCVHDVQWKFEA